MQLKFNLMLHAKNNKKKKPNRIFYILNNIHIRKIYNVYMRSLVYYPVPKAEK